MPRAYMPNPTVGYPMAYDQKSGQYYQQTPSPTYPPYSVGAEFTMQQAQTMYGNAGMFGAATVPSVSTGLLTTAAAMNHHQHKNGLSLSQAGGQTLSQPPTNPYSMPMPTYYPGNISPQDLRRTVPVMF
ncbi:Uncharacterised protein g10371 [Pycnogonum litorale]